MRKKGRRKKVSKEGSMKHHFKKRMAFRFGEDITQEDIDAIVKKIQNGRTEVVEKQSNRVVVHKVRFHGQDVFIPYDKQRKLPITALFDDETYDNMMYGGTV